MDPPKVVNMNDFMARFGHLTPNQLLAGINAVTVENEARSPSSSSNLPKLPKFDYKMALLRSPTTSIRLIDLHPQSANTTSGSSSQSDPVPISCTIYPASLDSLPPFKALSYAWGNTWGTSSSNQTITICNNAFQITSSLFTALRHLRHPTKTIALWIDQICINQNDPEEKSQQVPLMAQIYSGAEEVLVWLGLAADKSNELMDAWHQAGKAAEEWGLDEYLGVDDRLGELGHIFSKTNPEDPKTIAYHNICAKIGPLFDLEALAAWYKRPWFSRVWIVQEFCLGRNTVFVCGKKRVAVDLVRFAQYIFQHYWGHRGELLAEEETRRDMAAVMINPLSSLFSARSRRRKYDNEKGKGDKLFKLLRELYVRREMKATDERDRVFGLLSLATDTEKLGIRPDYTVSDLAKVYTHIARAIIRDGNLDLLGLAQFPKLFAQLPSWVPDWTGAIRPPFYNDSPISKPLFAAAGNSRPSLLPVEDERCIGLEGYLVDEIEEVGGPWVGTETGANIDQVRCLTYLSEIEMMCKLSQYKNGNEGLNSSSGAFWSVSIGDIEATTVETRYKDSKIVPKN